MSANLVTIRRALISVSDKTGLSGLAKALADRGVEILSTGGSAKALVEAGVPVREVADHTGFPEMLDGRVKTLHPAIHGGLLGRRDVPEHLAAMEKHGIAPIDLLVVNLYPFEATVARGASFETCIENIDIGGPALIRAAAKNRDSVAVVTDPEDYAALLSELDAHDGATTAELRRQLAATGYGRTATYDAAISTWFAAQVDEEFPRHVAIAGTRRQRLRYGENPHQTAAYYVGPGMSPEPVWGIPSAQQLQGKELSYNNINDTDAAFDVVSEFDRPAVAIIKHANPCGVAVADNLLDAWRGAFRCDPVSPFGGIVAVNRVLDGAFAEEVSKIFTEVVIAPDADADARRIFAARKNLRLLLTGGMANPATPGITFRSTSGGFLLQSRDNGRIGAADLRVVTKRAPTAQEIADVLLAFTVCKHVKSNAIVYVKNGATVGIGAGQMSRVDSSRIAARKAADAAEAAGEAVPLTVGSVVASDAFFPFADGLLAAAEAGATAVIQPGGSMRDAEVIAAADEKGLAMVFTGMRHFRH